jgi:hypothetical protein
VAGRERGEIVSLDGAESASNCSILWANGRTMGGMFWAGKARPDRIRLPGYPFAKERYWIASAFSKDSGGNETVEIAQAAPDEKIEDIINRIIDDSIEAGEGVKLLKMVV